MSQQPLRKPLEQLQNELDRAYTDGAADPQLSALHKTTRQLLDHSEPRPPATFRTQLTAAVAQFEVSHPTLTVAIMNVIDALNRIGI